MTGGPSVDPGQTKRFVSALFRHANEGGFVSLRGFYDDALAKRRDEKPFKIVAIRLNGNGLEPLIKATARLAEDAAAARRPVVVAPPIATFASGRASENNLLEGLALSVELDERPAAALARLRPIIGQPTLVVASGGVWVDPETGEVHDKLHVHWRLNEPTQTVDGHQQLKRARALACDLVGADATSKPVVHPMRWAGTLHRKNPEAPRCATIVEENSDSEISLGDVLSELEGLAILREAAADERPAAAAGDPGADGELLAACAQRIPNADLAWAAWNRLGMAFYRASGGAEDGLAAFDTVSRKSPKHDAAATRARWEHYATSPPDRIGAPTLVYEARKADPAFRRKRAASTTVADGLAEGELRDEISGGDLSHDALALAWGEDVATTARHVDKWGQWYLWEGTHWGRDEKRLVWTKVREFVRPRALGLTAKAATKLRSAETIAAVVSLARSNRELAAGVKEWDRDPYLLGTPGGTVDLRTGELRDADPADQITKLTAVSPASVGTDAPAWRTFLERIFRHDLELIPFMQRALGYALTGEIREHAVFFAYGQGGNGKGVLLNTASRLLGDYAAIAPQDMLLVTQSDRHPCDMAMLRGARLVTAQELAAGRAWDEPKLKSLTGGDPISARFMRQDFFTYEPQLTLFVAGNHKPSFKGVDEAIRRRVLLLPFLQNIPAAERDPALPEKLKAEWPAILRWMIDGCLDWQRGGLRPPACVRVATDDYLNAEDVLGQWLEEMCVVSARIGWTPLTDLYGAWKAWCEARGQHPSTSTALSKKLDERGFRREKKERGAGFWGMRLASAQSADGNDGSGHIDRNDPFHASAVTPAGRGERTTSIPYVEYGGDHHFRQPQGGEVDL